MPKTPRFSTLTGFARGDMPVSLLGDVLDDSLPFVLSRIDLPVVLTDADRHRTGTRRHARTKESRSKSVVGSTRARCISFDRETERQSVKADRQAGVVAHTHIHT